MGCPYDDYENLPTPSDFDRLFARLILAFQAETGLDEINIAGLTAYMKVAKDLPRIDQRLPMTSEEVKMVVGRLKRFGYVWIENDTVSITAVGLLICGPLRIPEDIAKAFGEKIDVEILSRA